MQMCGFCASNLQVIYALYQRKTLLLPGNKFAMKLMDHGGLEFFRVSCNGNSVTLLEEVKDKSFSIDILENCSCLVTEEEYEEIQKIPLGEGL
jgi:hypothetical protein